ncbi:hypothetical protein ACXHMN_11155 [Rhizobium sp. LEGMi12c]
MKKKSKILQFLMGVNRAVERIMLLAKRSFEVSLPFIAIGVGFVVYSNATPNKNIGTVSTTALLDGLKDYAPAIILVSIVISGAVSALIRYLEPQSSRAVSHSYKISPEVAQKLRSRVLNEKELGEIKAEIIARAAADIATAIHPQSEKKDDSDPDRADEKTLVINIFKAAHVRLTDALDSLERRANLNLIFGIVISIAGTTLLWYFILLSTAEISENINIESLAIRFTMRLSIVIFVQIFSYFFLRLYRYSIFETKYFQNELTNLEYRYAAFVAAIGSGDKKLLSTIATELSKTERNFILKKGETTINLQREQLELAQESALIEKITAMVRRTQSEQK